MPDILPALGHGVTCLTIAGADAVAAFLLGFGGACGKGKHIAVAFGVAGLNLLFGVTVLLFSVDYLSNIGIHFREWQPILFGQCWDYWSHLIYHF